MRFSMLYSGEQILSFKSCLVLYAGDSLIFQLNEYLAGLTEVQGTVDNRNNLQCQNYITYDKEVSDSFSKY